MIGPVIFLVATAAIVVSAALFTAALRLRGAAAFLLGTYLVAYAELVLIVAALSFFHLVVRWAVVSVTFALLAVAVLLWTRLGRPAPPSGRRTLSRLRAALRDPALAVLAGALLIGLGYLTALALWTPPNSWDAMWYHLSRAAFWKQQHAVGYIAHANDVRLNVNPPVGEIGLLYTMVVAASDRFVTLVALAAYCVTPVGVFALARRLHADIRAALLAGLVFATLPVVVLQASGALNDVVLASFLVASVYFGLGGSRTELGLAALALALALGTKLDATLALPIIAVIVLLGQPRRRALALAIAGVAAVVLGSVWYVVNVHETGAVEGHLSAGHRAGARGGLVRPVAFTARLALDFLEVPGAAGWWVISFVVAAAGVSAFALRERGDRRVRTAVLAGFVSLVPVALVWLGPIATRGFQWTFFHLGYPGLGILDQDRGLLGASALASFYGPIGLFLLVSVVPLLMVRGGVPRVAIVFALAPIAFAVELALTLGYNPFFGRYFVFAVALACAAATALAGLWRPVVWGVVAVAAVTLGLTLRANDEKPPGVWGEPRWRVQTTVGPGDGEAQAIRFAETSIPPRARIGLALTRRDWSYPFFGPQLERVVRFVAADRAAKDLGWLVVAPGKGTPGHEWTTVLRTPDGWRVYERAQA